MSKRALLVGIDEYDNKKIPKLSGCVRDANAMAQALSRHGNSSVNFDCQVLISPGYSESITRAYLKQKWNSLFADFAGDVLFYFSGHGTATETGGYLVTQDASDGDWGLAMNDLLTLANASKARSALLILDCCYSGGLGNPPNLPANQAQLREGVTVLSASLPTQTAKEVGGHGVFTELLLGGLYGGAADVRGRVSAASVYAYVEEALGPWDQRPMYKSHASKLEPIRYCEPLVSDGLLRELPALFSDAQSVYSLAPSYERTHTTSDPKHVETFDKLKLLQNAGLLRIISGGSHLYYAALDSHGVQLTELGKFYWRLAKGGRI